MNVITENELVEALKSAKINQDYNNDDATHIEDIDNVNDGEMISVYGGYVWNEIEIFGVTVEFVDTWSCSELCDNPIILDNSADWKMHVGRKEVEELPFKLIDGDGDDISSDFFEIVEYNSRIKKFDTSALPSPKTHNKESLKQITCFKDYKSASKKCAEMNKEFKAGKELYFIYGVRKENSSVPIMNMDGFEIMTRQEFKDKFEA